MKQAEQIIAIRQTLSQLSQAHLTAALCVSQLEELVAVDTENRLSPEMSLPRADETGFRVTWQGRSCYLGHTKCFRIFACLLRRTDHYVSYEQLLRDAWNGDAKSPDTVRSAIRELKSRLSRARMRRLARAIHGQGKHYGLILSEA